MTVNPELPGDQETESRSKAASRSASQLNLRADPAETHTQGVMLSELLGFSRWLLVLPFVLVVLFVAGQVALMRQPIVAAGDTRSMLSADYSPWEFASFAPVGIDIIAQIQGESGVSIARLVIPGNYWPGPPQASQEPASPPPRATPVAAVLTDTPPAAKTNVPNTPTPTATSTAAPPTSSPQPTEIYTRTPTPSKTPIFTLFPTSTPTPTRRPPGLPTATNTVTVLPSPTASRTPTPTGTASPLPSATQPPPTATATTAPSATAITPPTQAPTDTSVPPTPTETTPPPPPTATHTPVPVFTPTNTPITPVPVETPTPLPPPPNNPSGAGSNYIDPSWSGTWDDCWYMYQTYLPREFILTDCQNIPQP